MVLRHPSVLITDDDRAFRETLREVFEPRGFRTLIAGDGAEAIEIVRREHVHLAVLDMHMPRFTGIEVIREIKQVHATLPCILLSAGMDDLLEEQALEAQAYSAHRKPISIREIIGVVADAMSQTYRWSPSPEAGPGPGSLG